LNQRAGATQASPASGTRRTRTKAPSGTRSADHVGPRPACPGTSEISSM
jgi:hypothetical protein